MIDDRPTSALPLLRLCLLLVLAAFWLKLTMVADPSHLWFFEALKRVDSGLGIEDENTKEEGRKKRRQMCALLRTSLFDAAATAKAFATVSWGLRRDGVGEGGGMSPDI
jgi:hypothetical protein